MATLVTNIDCSGTFGTYFNVGAGGYAQFSAGTLVFDGEGIALLNTSLGSGDKWLRFKFAVNVGGSGIGFALGDASGNSILYLIDREFDDPRITAEQEYDAYVTPGTSGSPTNSTVAFVDGGSCGVTWQASTETARLWFGVTAAEPDSVTSWDSSAADSAASEIAWSTMGTPLYAGFGCWTSSPLTHYFDDITAGDFAAGGGSLPRMSKPILQAVNRASTF